MQETVYKNESTSTAQSVVQANDKLSYKDKKELMNDEKNTKDNITDELFNTPDQTKETELESKKQDKGKHRIKVYIPKYIFTDIQGIIRTIFTKVKGNKELLIQPIDQNVDDGIIIRNTAFNMSAKDDDNDAISKHKKENTNDGKTDKQRNNKDDMNANKKTVLRLFLVCKYENDDYIMLGRIKHILQKPLGAVCLIVLQEEINAHISNSEQKVRKNRLINEAFGQVVNYTYSSIRKGVEHEQNKQSTIEIETFLQKEQVQIFCRRHGTMPTQPTVQPRLINELRTHLKQMYTSDVILYFVDTPECVSIDEPVIVVCFESSRMYADMKKAIYGLKSKKEAKMGGTSTKTKTTKQADDGSNTAGTKEDSGKVDDGSDTAGTKEGSGKDTAETKEDNGKDTAETKEDSGKDTAKTKVDNGKEEAKMGGTSTKPKPTQSTKQADDGSDTADTNEGSGKASTNVVVDLSTGNEDIDDEVENVNDDTPWRDIGDITLDDSGLAKLKKEIQTLKPDSSVPQMNIALIGQIQAGRSSFINTIDSALKGFVDDIASAHPDKTSVTMKYTKYQISKENNENTNEYKRFCFCDTRGVINMDDPKYGLTSANITCVLRGNIKEGYEFDVKRPIQQNSKFYITHPHLKDQIHCVCYVINGNTVKMLPQNALPKIAEFLTTIERKHGLRYVVLITHMDMVCEEVCRDTSRMYKSKKVESIVNYVKDRLDAIPFRNIVPIVNYNSQVATTPSINSSAFLALRQILRKAQSVIEQKVKVADKS